MMQTAQSAVVLNNKSACSGRNPNGKASHELHDQDDSRMVGELVNG